MIPDANDARHRLEVQATRELEVARIAAGEVQCAEGCAVDVNVDLVVAGVIAECCVIGQVRAFNTEHKVHPLVDGEGTAQRHVEPIVVGPAKVIRKARGVADHKITGIAERPTCGCTRYTADPST